MTELTDLLDPSFLIVLLTGVAVFATAMAFLPQLGGDPMKHRMRTMALQRDELRARQRARISADGPDRRRNALRHTDEGKMRRFVDGLDLRKALLDDKTVALIRGAGFRGQSPITRFLFLRATLPLVFLVLAALYVFGLGLMAEHPLFIRLLVVVFGAYIGFYLPVLYVRNRATKRMQAVKRAWPDALDLLLICVESGISIEAAFRRVSEEIGVQSMELAEELMLTTAELAFLEDRRLAYENLVQRTQLDAVKSVCQALIQSERYGTPIGSALRVLAKESREMRMNEAEKKAAALPPKLTVPMILFFLPVLFIVVLTPAGMELSAGLN